MKKLSMLLVITLMMSGLSVLTGCSSNDDDMSPTDRWPGLTLTRDPEKQEAKTVIKYFERSGLKLHVVDITERYTDALYALEYKAKSVPVNHFLLENLPPSIQTMVMQWGENGLTKVFRLEYQGETYYDISNFLQSSMINIYDAEGNALGPGSASYSTLINEAQIRCILVLDTEIVKSAENAPNYLIGFWQNDWQHMIHDNIQDIRILYPDLSFCITEVIFFRADGTGYLRTVKTNKNGSSEIALDPFRYELTDYHGGEQYGYHGYYYKCYFQAGDVIEYQARSFDNMQTLVSHNMLECYPWFKQANDPFESQEVNAGQKYGVPARDNDSPIVGRWTGGEYSNVLMKDIFTTWVFRSDNTGYSLRGDEYDESFAYTVTYNGSKANVTIYKYNTGLFDNEINGTTINATFNGDGLELEGWGSYSRQE